MRYTGKEINLQTKLRAVPSLSKLESLFGKLKVALSGHSFSILGKGADR